MNTFKEDKHIERTGIIGNGHERIYDKKTGRMGSVDSFGNVELDPEEEKVQPKKKKTYEEEDGTTTPVRNQPLCSQDSINEIKDAFHDANRTFAHGALGIFGIIFGVAAYKGLKSELKKNPGNLKGAFKKADSNTGNVFEIFFTIIVLVVLAFVFSLFAESWGKIGSIIYDTIVILGVIYIWGNIRELRGKPFFIQIRGKKVPILLRIGIVIFSIVKLTWPIFTKLDEWLTPFVVANGEYVFSESVMIAIVIALFVGSAIVAALPGLIACKIIKLITGRR